MYIPEKKEKKVFSSSLSRLVICVDTRREKVEKRISFFWVRLRPSERIAHLGDLFLLLGGKEEKSGVAREKEEEARPVITGITFLEWAGQLGYKRLERNGEGMYTSRLCVCEYTIPI